MQEKTTLTKEEVVRKIIENEKIQKGTRVYQLVNERRYRVESESIEALVAEMELEGLLEHGDKEILCLTDKGRELIS